MWWNVWGDVTASFSVIKLINAKERERDSALDLGGCCLTIESFVHCIVHSLYCLFIVQSFTQLHCRLSYSSFIVLFVIVLFIVKLAHHHSLLYHLLSLSHLSCIVSNIHHTICSFHYLLSHSLFIFVIILFILMSFIFVLFIHCISIVLFVHGIACFCLLDLYNISDEIVLKNCSLL